jgi:hypothetical protein
MRMSLGSTNESTEAMRYSLVGLLFSAVVACGAPVATSGDVTADRSGEVTLRTDRAAYSATPIGGEGPYRTYAATLVAQVTNGMSRPVYLQRCYPETPYPIYGIVSAEEGREAAYNPAWACVGHDLPIVVSAGYTRTDSLRIAGPNAWDGRTKEPFGDLVGRFRLSYAVGTCRAVSGCELPGRTESNEFEVRLEP